MAPVHLFARLSLPQAQALAWPVYPFALLLLPQAHALASPLAGAFANAPELDATLRVVGTLPPLERGVLFKKGPARFSRGAATALPSTRTGWTATGWSVSQPARPADGSAAAHRATWRGACTAAEWRRLGCLGSETTYCSGGGTSYQQVRPPRIAPATSQPITCTSLSQNTVANVSEFAFFVVLTRSAVLNAARPT